MKAQKNVKEFSCQTMPKQNKTCFYATILGVMQSSQEFSKPVLAHVRAWKCLDGHVESKQLWSPIKRISVAFRFINFLVSTLKFGLSFRLGFSYMFSFQVQGSWVWGFTPHRCSGLKIYFLLLVQDHRLLGFQVSGSYISRK